MSKKTDKDVLKIVTKIENSLNNKKNSFFPYKNRYKYIVENKIYKERIELAEKTLINPLKKNKIAELLMAIKTLIIFCLIIYDFKWDWRYILALTVVGLISCFFLHMYLGKRDNLTLTYNGIKFGSQTLIPWSDVKYIYFKLIPQKGKRIDWHIELLINNSFNESVCCSYYEMDKRQLGEIFWKYKCKHDIDNLVVNKK